MYCLEAQQRNVCKLCMLVVLSNRFSIYHPPHLHSPLLFSTTITLLVEELERLIYRLDSAVVDGRIFWVCPDLVGEQGVEDNISVALEVRNIYQ